MLYMGDITNEHLSLVSILLKNYGFKGLMDYETEVSATSIRDIPDFYTKLNEHTRTIDRLFPVHDINVRRCNFKIETGTQAMNILRSVLTYVGIPWRSRRTNNTIKLRLVDLDQQEGLIGNIQLNTHLESLRDETVTTHTYPCHRVVNSMLSEPYTYRHGYELCYRLTVTGLEDRDISKIQVTDMSLLGKAYTIRVGSSPMWCSRIGSDNLLPMPLLPTSQLRYHKLEIDIFSSVSEPLTSVELRITHHTSTLPPKSSLMVGRMAWPSVVCHRHDCTGSAVPNWFNYINGMGGVSHNCKHNVRTLTRDRPPITKLTKWYVIPTNTPILLDGKYIYHIDLLAEIDKRSDYVSNINVLSYDRFALINVPEKISISAREKQMLLEPEPEPKLVISSSEESPYVVVSVIHNIRNIVQKVDPELAKILDSALRERPTSQRA